MTESEREQMKIMRNTIDVMLNLLANGRSLNEFYDLWETYGRMMQDAVNKAHDG